MEVTAEISERHRHRFEVNPEMIDQFEKSGLHFVATCTEGERMEVLEMDRADHPFFVATQYHPEFLSRPLKPSPPFLGLVLAACGELNDYLAKMWCVSSQTVEPKRYSLSREEDSSSGYSSSRLFMKEVSRKSGESTSLATSSELSS